MNGILSKKRCVESQIMTRLDGMSFPTVRDSVNLGILSYKSGNWGDENFFLVINSQVFNDGSHRTLKRNRTRKSHKEILLL